MTGLKTFFREENKNTLLLRIACLCWFLGKLMSWRIWTTHRLLPTAPLFRSLDLIPPVVQTIVFALSLFLVIAVFVRCNRFFLTSLLVLEIFSCLLDQNRWLPWEYFYVFIIFIFLVNAGTPGYKTSCIAFLLVATYFYSGLCKLNEGFVHVVWINLMLRNTLHISSTISDQAYVHSGGYLLGLMEMFAGLGLLFVKTQKKSAIILIGMHVAILLFLFSLGFKHYEVLWPWNITLGLFLYFIFLKDNEGSLTFQPVTKGWNKLVLVCWGILPVLSFWGYWDKNLSSNLFSANVPEMFICVKDTSACKPIRKFCNKKDSRNICNGEAVIDIQSWARRETNASVDPELRVYKAMQEKLEKQYGAAGLTFVYFTGWSEKQ